jgi:dTDP-4-dehydrorhamnose 3,5-epimerase
MNVIETTINGVLILEPKVFGDERGFFMESWNQLVFDAAIGRRVGFVQDNHSRSAKGVLRGLHYQLQNPQAKLVRVTQGTVLDVVVDLRNSSPSFGKSISVELSEQNKRQLWIPEGLAHGFVVLSDSADFLYKATDYYHPASERCLLWKDPALGIDWPVPPAGGFVVSAKDQQSELFDKAKVYFS